MYLVRFVVGKEDASVSSVRTISSLYQPKPANTPSHHNDRCSSLPASTSTKDQHIGEIKTRYPASVSIDTLLKAGKSIKPADKRKETLTFGTFDVANQKWSDAFEAVCYIETKEFSSGGFRKAHHATFANNAPMVLGDDGLSNCTTIRQLQQSQRQCSRTLRVTAASKFRCTQLRGILPRGSK